MILKRKKNIETKFRLSNDSTKKKRLCEGQMQYKSLFSYYLWILFRSENMSHFKMFESHLQLIF